MPKGRKKHIVTIDELRRKFPLGATVYFKGEPFATVCGYNRFINDSYNNEPEVMYLSWKIDKIRYPDRAIGQFTVRSQNFKTRPHELTIYERHFSGIGTRNRRVITVWFDPKTRYEHEVVWRDVTNSKWAIWDTDLHKVVRT